MIRVMAFLCLGVTLINLIAATCAAADTDSYALLQAGVGLNRDYKHQSDRASDDESSNKSVRKNHRISQLPHILHVGATSGDEWEYSDQWQNTNPGWKVDILTDTRIKSLISTHFPQAAPLIQPGNSEELEFGVELSDLGRLVALAVEGGVYIDSDVQGLLSIDEWPAQYHVTESDVDVVMGLEWAPEDNDVWTKKSNNGFEITNWAMLAKPGTSILRSVVENLLKSATSRPDNFDNIIQRFGPGGLTRAILSILHEHGLTPSRSSSGHGQLFAIEAPDGNIEHLLILPRRAFANWKGPEPKNVIRDAQNLLEGHLVRHMFSGSWRVDGDDEDDEDDDDDESGEISAMEDEYDEDEEDDEDEDEEDVEEGDENNKIDDDDDEEDEDDDGEDDDKDHLEPTADEDGDNEEED